MPKCTCCEKILAKAKHFYPAYVYDSTFSIVERFFRKKIIPGVVTGDFSVFLMWDRTAQGRIGDEIRKRDMTQTLEPVCSP